jgi:hypothetical protein
MLKIRVPKFPGLYQRGFQTGCLRAANVNFDVIADHEDLLSRHMQPARCCSKESRARLSKHKGLPPGSVRKGNHERGHVESDSIWRHPVPRHSQRNELRFWIAVE